MRRVQRVAVSIGAVCLTIGLLPGLAAAHHDPLNPNHPAGGSSGNAIWVSTGASGGAKRGYTQCPWERGWPTGVGATESRGIPSFIRSIIERLGLPTVGDPSDPASVELIPIGEADLDGDGEIDEDFIVPILDDEEEYVIGETEGINWLNELLLRIRGTHDLGVFIEDGNGALDADDLTEEELQGDRYRESSSYPIVQRGTDPSTGDDLFWDPWFVSPEEQTGSCPAGVIYSPRLNNPTILLPDLQAFVSELLPPASPTLIPVDSREGWAYVQVPTNFGVVSSSLVRQSAHAEVQFIEAGNVSAMWADLRAIPTNLVFQPGDGSDPITCHISQMAFVPDDPGACSHVYLDSSNVTPGGVFEGTVSVLWLGIYSDSTGATRLVDIVPTSANFSVEVAEARAAVSFGG